MVGSRNGGHLYSVRNVMVSIDKPCTYYSAHGIDLCDSPIYPGMCYAANGYFYEGNLYYDDIASVRSFFMVSDSLA